jgi:hypothetical protein
MKKSLVALAVFVFNFITFMLLELLVVYLLLSIRMDPGNRQIFAPFVWSLRYLRFILPLLWGLVGAWVAYRWFAEKEQVAFERKLNQKAAEIETLRVELSTPNLPTEKALQLSKVMLSRSAELRELVDSGPEHGTSFLDVIETRLPAR